MSAGVRRAGRWLAASAAFFLAACDNPAPAPQQRPPAAKPSYDAELRKLDAAITDGLSLSTKRNDEALLRIEVASLYVERARLTGAYADYGRAQAVLDALPESARALPSVCLARAKLHFTLHRLAKATAALAECPAAPDDPQQAALRADIAMHSGRYAEAGATFRALVNASGLSPQYVQLALLRSHTGAPGEATALLEAAEKRYHGGSATTKAWLKLQRGLVALDRGQLEEALAMYRLASDELPGWWLIDEHIAEALAFEGKHDEARRIYKDVIERTGAPEFLDALAAIEAHDGHEAESRALLARARKAYEDRLASFPEAAAGHALAHYLRDPADAKFALELARRNHATRPGGEATVELAKAWLLSGRADNAIPLLEAELAKGWDTAETWWVLSEALKRAGRNERSVAARQNALQRNPRSEQMYALAPAPGR